MNDIENLVQLRNDPMFQKYIDRLKIERAVYADDAVRPKSLTNNWERNHIEQVMAQSTIVGLDIAITLLDVLANQLKEQEKKKTEVSGDLSVRY